MHQIRDGKKVAPTCPSCGCRLSMFEDMWYHFWGSEIQDARGCRCKQYKKGFEFAPKNKFDNGNTIMV